MKKISVTLFLFALAGCQSASKLPADVTATAAANTIAGSQWQSFCSPVVNERGEVVESKEGPNSGRPEFENISGNEYIWINMGFKDGSCKELFNGSKTYVKCENDDLNAEGFRTCVVTKTEMAGFHKDQIDRYNKSKSCGINDWKQDGWIDVTNSNCKNTQPFIFKATTEDGLLTLRIQSEAGSTLTSKFKRK